MATRSVLVQLPPNPFSIESLRPLSSLASFAAVLAEAGHSTTILDCCTVESFDRLYCSEVRAQFMKSTVKEVLSSDGTRRQVVAPFWHYHRGSRLLKERHRDLAMEVATQIGRMRHIDFVLLHIQTHDDISSASQFAEKLRELRPEVAIVGVGAHLRSHAKDLERAVRFLDCVHLAPPARQFSELADRLSRKRGWSDVPDIAYREGTRILTTYSSTYTYHGPTPAPLYHPEVYTALRDETKIHVFDVEVYPEHLRPDAANRLEADTGSVTTSFRKSAKAVGNEVAGIHRMYATRAFHFVGCDGCPRGTDALSFELMSRGIGLSYSRDADVGAASFSTIAAMKGSGCCAVSFRVDSGSQRLLDDYYCTYLSVSTIEDVIETARRAEVYTVARFTYPCIMDDYHTKAETLRLIERAAPNGVLITHPHVAGISDSPFAIRTGARQRKPLSVKKSRVEHEELAAAIEELGIHTEITAQTALMAALCGSAGRERAFRRHLESTLLSGDGIALAAAVERINRAARSSSPASNLKPFVPFQNAIGN